LKFPWRLVLALLETVIAAYDAHHNNHFESLIYLSNCFLMGLEIWALRCTAAVFALIRVYED